jgi:hypothetical protein
MLTLPRKLAIVELSTYYIIVRGLDGFNFRCIEISDRIIDQSTNLHMNSTALLYPPVSWLSCSSSSIRTTLPCRTASDTEVGGQSAQARAVKSSGHRLGASQGGAQRVHVEVPGKRRAWLRYTLHPLQQGASALWLQGRVLSGQNWYQGHLDSEGAPRSKLTSAQSRQICGGASSSSKRTHTAGELGEHGGA